MPLFRRIHRSLLMALIDVVLDIERRVSKATLGMVQVQVDALEALINLESALGRRIKGE